MMHEPDGVGEAVEELLRGGLAAAGALARARAHSRAQRLHAAAQASEQSARQLRAAIEVDRAAARAQLATVTQTQWWDRATAQEIAAAWQTAQEWRDSDPEAAKASVRIRAELDERYGIDPRQYAAEQTIATGAPDTATAATSQLSEAATRALNHIVGRTRQGDFANRLWNMTEPDWNQAIDELRDARYEIYWTHGTVADDPTITGGWRVVLASGEPVGEVEQGRRLAAISHHATVSDAVGRGGPSSPPRARRARGRGGQRVQRERGR
jgi:hypothetical protein